MQRTDQIREERKLKSQLFLQKDIRDLQLVETSNQRMEVVKSDQLSELIHSKKGKSNFSKEKILPKLRSRFSNNRCSVLLDLSYEEFGKLGIKPEIGWGSISEPIISNILQISNLLQKWEDQKEIRLLDPFSGSGTILMTSLVNFLKIPVRKDLSLCTMGNWPIMHELDQQNILNSLQKVSTEKGEKIRAKVIGFELSTSQFRAQVKNFSKLASEANLDQIRSSSSSESELYSPYKTSYKIGEGIELYRASFAQYLENIKKEDLENMDILTNMPWGMKEMKSSQAEDLFDQFDAFLSKNKEKLGEVLLIYPETPKYARDPFYVAESDYFWNEEATFYSGGVKVSLYRFSRELKAEKEIALRPESASVLEYDDLSKEVKKDDYFINLVTNSREMKKVQKAVRQKRRNNFLKLAKEKRELQKSKEEEFKQKIRTKKVEKLERRLGLGELEDEEVDLLRTNVENYVKKKKERIDKFKKDKERKVPSW